MKSKQIYEKIVDEVIKSIKRNGYITNESANEIFYKNLMSTVSDFVPNNYTGDVFDSGFIADVFDEFNETLKGREEIKRKGLPKLKYFIPNLTEVYALNEAELEKGYLIESKKLEKENRKIEKQLIDTKERGLGAMV